MLTINLMEPTDTIVKRIVDSNSGERDVCAECCEHRRIFLLVAEKSREDNNASYGKVCEDCLPLKIDIFRGMGCGWKQVRVLN